MARGVNKVILLGNVGGEPDVKSLPSGTIVATFSLATSESWTDRQTGSKQEKTEWHRVVFFAKLAEIVQQYVHKGSQIYIEGKLRTQKWQDQQGNNRYTTEVLGNELQFLGSKSDNTNSSQSNYQPNYEEDFASQNNYSNNSSNYANSANSNGAYAQNQQKYGANSNSNQQQQASAPQEYNDGGFDSYDDEIPF